MTTSTTTSSSTSLSTKDYIELYESYWCSSERADNDLQLAWKKKRQDEEEHASTQGPSSIFHNNEENNNKSSDNDKHKKKEKKKSGDVATATAATAMIRARSELEGVLISAMNHSTSSSHRPKGIEHHLECLRLTNDLEYSQQYSKSLETLWVAPSGSSSSSHQTTQINNNTNTTSIITSKVNDFFEEYPQFVREVDPFQEEDDDDDDEEEDSSGEEDLVSTGSSRRERKKSKRSHVENQPPQQQQENEKNRSGSSKKHTEKDIKPSSSSSSHQSKPTDNFFYTPSTPSTPVQEASRPPAPPPPLYSQQTKSQQQQQPPREPRPPAHSTLARNPYASKPPFPPPPLPPPLVSRPAPSSWDNLHPNNSSNNNNNGNYNQNHRPPPPPPPLSRPSQQPPSQPQQSWDQYYDSNSQNPFLSAAELAGSSNEHRRHAANNAPAYNHPNRGPSPDSHPHQPPQNGYGMAPPPNPPPPPPSQYSQYPPQPPPMPPPQRRGNPYNNANNNNPYSSPRYEQASPPPPPKPSIRESLQKPFQNPQRNKSKGKPNSNKPPPKAGLANNPHKITKKKEASNNNSRGESYKPNAHDNNNNSNEDDDEDDLPEELKRYGKDLVEKIESEIIDVGDPITFDDIAGLDAAKETIYEAIIWPIQRPEIFSGLRSTPRALLLFGPPGTGKTLIGKAVANQCGATFFSISSSSLTSKWIGEGEKLVRTMFAVAAYREPAVIFIDEIDSLLTQRSSSENEASRRIKTEFLVQMDGTGTSKQGRVMTIGATNRPQELDEAARRRFVKRLYIPLPNQADRLVLIHVMLKNNKHSLTEADLSKLARETEGYSGADLKSLCTDAAMGPLRANARNLADIEEKDIPPISYKDFRHSLRNTKPSVSGGDTVQYEDWNREYGSRSSAGDESDANSDADNDSEIKLDDEGDEKN